MARKTRLPVDAARGDRQKRDGIGRSKAHVARIGMQGFIDRRGENLNPHRQAQQRRVLEGFDRAHEEDQKGRG